MDQSFRWAFGLPLGWGIGPRAMPMPNATLEKATLLVHYAMVLSLAWFTMSPLQAIVHYVVSNGLTGLGLASSFVVGHNGMRMVDADDSQPPFAPLQIYTTRNVDDDIFGLTGWFMGGLHLQVEHHLFPTMPRHSLAVAQPFVRALCKKHGLPYHSTSFAAGLYEVMGALDVVAKDFIRDFPAA
jgi:fatty acid desaturase